MELQLLRTFLEIVAVGSFVGAAERLNITQSAVSLRVRRLEEALGRKIFIRANAGVELTPAGLRFERHARLMVSMWEEAKYDVTLPAEYEDLLNIGCQYSLWPKLGGRWLRHLEKAEPKIAFRVETGRPDYLMHQLVQGATDIGILYTPQMRPGLSVDRLIEDTLILVSTDPDYGNDLDDRYVFIDWGPEFATAHALQYPSFQAARTTLGIGPLALNFIVDRNRAAYFPTRVVKPLIDRRELHIVAGAPVFPFPAYVVWNQGMDSDLTARVLKSLKRCAEEADQEQADILKEWNVDLVEQLAQYF